MLAAVRSVITLRQDASVTEKIRLAVRLDASDTRRFTIVVARGERAGTWRIGLRCAGTLRLKDISSGYHHYYRVAGANGGCAALGIDCLKCVGAQIADVFVPDSGRTTASTCVASAEGDRDRLPRLGNAQPRSRCWFGLEGEALSLSTEEPPHCAERGFRSSPGL